MIQDNDFVKMYDYFYVYKLKAVQMVLCDLCVYN